MKEKNYKTLRKNNSMNVKAGRRTKGKDSCTKDKVNIRWSEGEDETEYFTHTTEILGVSLIRNCIL